MELNEIKGIGNKTLMILEKLGIYRLDDLVNYYPYRYNLYRRSDINLLNQDDKIIIDGVIETYPTLFYFNKKMNKMNFKFNTGSNLLNVNIFNRGYLKNKLLIGNYVTIIGKYDKKNNSIAASDIKLCKLDSLPKIEAIYHLVNGITNNQITNFISEALNSISTLDETLPEYILDKYKFISKYDAVCGIHNPIDTTNYKQSKLRLVYEELFNYMIKIICLKSIRKREIGLKKSVKKELVDEFISKLPFKLTFDQLKSIDEIYSDMTSEIRMNRLLQGDVGSGKTIVAFISLYINYLSGYQGVLMAPTEILANQHFNNIKNLFKDYDINIELLTGKLKVKDRKTILERLKNNKIDILIGTHALISNDVIFSNLGLVITDEQHRFGVNQRDNLKNKGNKVDILYMSATPIPRTYALTLYGDMDISSICTLPTGKGKITTILKDYSDIKNVLNIMYQELKNNHQIYVISPLIESENEDTDDVNKLKEKMNKAFGKLYEIDILHGKMNQEEKEKVMNDFKENKIQILISTTVIEVGIDVANASTIVIFNSDRFGLSQLHQLRGRVGRGKIDSYCILLSNKDTERLKIMTEVSDGFKISEEDFKLRGSGDLFGIRQSGDMIFKLANIKSDFNILKAVKEDCEYLISENLVDIDLLSKNLNLK